MPSSAEREIKIERVFDAPRDRVFAVYTDPALIPEWWGPRGTTTIVDEMDVRTGGRWRFIMRDADGTETGLRGAYREVTPPERIVQTFEWEPMAGHVSVETATFEDLGDRTKVTTISLFQYPRGARRHARVGHGGRAQRDLRPPRRAACEARRSLTGDEPGRRRRS
jgi:uncharacterized protein YndB with AHSA1/START domain